MPLGRVKIILNRIQFTKESRVTFDDKAGQLTFFCDVCGSKIVCILPINSPRASTWSDRHVIRQHFLGNGTVERCPVIPSLAGHAYAQAIERVLD